MEQIPVNDPNDPRHRERFEQSEVFITPEIKKQINSDIEGRIFSVGEKQNISEVGGRVIEREVPITASGSEVKPKTEPAGADLIKRIVNDGDDPSALRDKDPHQIMNALLDFLDHQ